MTLSVPSLYKHLKPRPNDRNMPTQHIATLLGATCFVRLATMLRCVAACWVLLAQMWPVSNLSQQHPTCCNTSQHGGQTHATCCAQQCCDMLRWHVAIVWPGLKKYKTCTMFLLRFRMNLLVFYHKCGSLICYATHSVWNANKQPPVFYM